MPSHVIALATELGTAADRHDFDRIWALIRALPEEVNKLDPSDFEPSVQSEFVLSRNNLRALGLQSTLSDNHCPSISSLAKKLVALLENHRGVGSGGTSRSFNFVKDATLRRIIGRDYDELKLKVFPARAWKSTVVLAGSILEAVLTDQLATDPVTFTQAVTSSKAPKNKSGSVKDLKSGDWTLAELIVVAEDIGILPANRAKSIDQILRDYRNFVHPKKEVRSGHPCTEAEGMMAIGVLEGVLNHLT